MTDIINGEVVDAIPEFVADYTEAVRIDQEICYCIGSITTNLANLVPLIRLAKTQQIHHALGFPTYSAYLGNRIGPSLKAFERVAVVSMLSDEGLTNRAIAEVIGTSHMTVNRDLEQVEHDVPLDPQCAPAEPADKIGRNGSKHAAAGRPRSQQRIDAEAALLHDDSETDTDIAKRIGVAKSTVQRTRLELEKAGSIPSRYLPGTTILKSKYEDAKRMLTDDPSLSDTFTAQRAGMSRETVRSIRQELVTDGTIPDVSIQVRNKVAKEKKAEENKEARHNGMTDKQLKKAAQRTIDHCALNIENVRESLEDTRPCDVVYTADNEELINQMHNDIKRIKAALAKLAKANEEGTHHE